MQIRHDHPLPEIILQWRKLNSVITKVGKKLVMWIRLILMYNSKLPFISLVVVDIHTNSSRKVVYLITLCCVVLLQMNFVVKLQSQPIYGNLNLGCELHIYFNNFRI